MRLIQTKFGGFFRKYVSEVNWRSLRWPVFAFHPRKGPVRQRHVFIRLELFRISRMFRHTWKLDDVFVVKSMIWKCPDCRPWEKQTRDKSSWNDPWTDTSFSPSERSKLNRLDQHLERGKEGARFGSSLDFSIRKRTVDYHMVLQTGY